MPSADAYAGLDDKDKFDFEARVFRFYAKRVTEDSWKCRSFVVKRTGMTQCYSERLDFSAAVSFLMVRLSDQTDVSIRKMLKSLKVGEERTWLE